jgi:8-oxo-dGTP diphosphatase
MAKRTQNPRSEEAAFLESYDPSVFARPSVTVDVVLFTVHEGALFTLVVRRTEHPFKGRWALPGGFVGIDEGLSAAAARVLHTKCSLDKVYLEQLGTFGEPKRDPRARVISVAYYALVDAPRFARRHARHAQRSEGPPDEHAQGRSVTIGKVTVPWAGEKGGPAHLHDERDNPMPLAFDHEDILGLAVKRIRGKLDYAPIGYQLLPERFTLLELQEVHQTVLGRTLNKDSFRRRMLASGDLASTGEMQSGVEHRPAELYRFLKRSAL